MPLSGVTAVVVVLPAAIAVIVLAVMAVFMLGDILASIVSLFRSSLPASPPRTQADSTATPAQTDEADAL